MSKKETSGTVHIKAPFPWFGGKRRVAPLVWQRFGDVKNYVEPFMGSCAVLLGRPHYPFVENRIETINDLDCYLANIWRCIKYDPDQTAEYADNWVCEADLHARHRWCYDNHEFRHRMRTEPEYYDCKVGGYWLFGISSWIGDNWCRVKGAGMTGVTPHLSDAGNGINRALPPADHLEQKIPHLLSSGQGINRALPPCEGGKGLIPTDIKEAEDYVGCVPHLTNSGKGINRALPPADHLDQTIPHLLDSGKGINRALPPCEDDGIRAREQDSVPNLGDSGQGINRALPPADHLKQQLPHLTSGGQGINQSLPPANLQQQLPNLAHNNGMGCNRTQDISPTRCRTKEERLADLKQYMRKLQDRLRFVRVCNGDWMRVCSPTVTYRHGLTGLFLDPPYSLEKNRQANVYGELSKQGNLNADLTKFLLENQNIDGLRVAICGLEGEYDLPKKYWDCVEWMGNSGYADKTVNKNREKERIWFNKQCIDPNKRPVGRPRKDKDERSLFKPEDY